MKLTVKTLYGLEGVLASELTAMGAGGVRAVNRAVICNGDRELLYRINYCSRLAISVLVNIDSFRIRSADDLYSGAVRTGWSKFMDTGSTFSIVPVVNSRLFAHTGYPALVVKDAVADHFREKYGKRPSVNVSDPDLMINLHISNDIVDLSLDSSVIPLFKRGYRIEQGIAPLNEVLAAGMLRLSGWQPGSPLHDPMCGSGTLPVEAGLIACDIPPGKFRSHFGFTRWRDYDEKLFRSVKEFYDKKISRLKIPLTAADISEQSVARARLNIASAGLGEQISVKIQDFFESRGKENKGFLIFNPPYGERIKPEETEKFYKSAGSTLKHNYHGYRVWIITAGKQLLNHVGLRPHTRLTLFNGSIECILAGYDLYEGSRKQKVGDGDSKNIN